MALNLKNPEVEQLAAEVASLAGETKTEAVRRALLERKQRLTLTRRGRLQKGERFLRYLEEEVWPKVPQGQLGRRLTSREEDAILGFGEDGV
jgi:antitoxin VapB